MLYYARGSKDDVISPEEVRDALRQTFEALGPRRKVLALPPDFTRFNSYAGPITAMCHDILGPALTDIMPALGTHTPMTSEQIHTMFPGVPESLFRIHDWRNDIVTVGEVPAEYVSRVTGGLVDYAWPAQVNKMLLDPSYDLILSIGQVVPHEVIGMANYTKNIFVGVGGAEGINKSHFIGSSYGMERIMGRAHTPVRDVLEYARQKFIPNLPIVYIQTVMAKDADGQMVMKGLFIGDDWECFQKASDLSLQVNFIMVERPIRKCIVWLDPAEFKSTWLGNKAIYRTRMALADGADLIILAPALKEFGEDKAIDALIRKYGYKGTPHTLECTKANPDLQGNLGASAHLIHGSSEGRFSITYCPGPGISCSEIEAVGYNYCDIEAVMQQYKVSTLHDGWNTVDGEEIYYISNPALGLWAHPDRFSNKTMSKSDIGMIGLAVMGSNLALNMESKGFKVSVFDREQQMIDDFIGGRGKGLRFYGPTGGLKDFVDSLAKPRKIMMMIRAGQPVDDYIEKLIPLLDEGDIIIDGGNTHFPDTARRAAYVESKGLLYIGTGVSGGEEGALKGPSMMPGGSPAAWPAVKPIFQSICAKVADGTPCCDWVGEGGAGHFVKMVHNGIEYGDIQLICECYQIMKDLLGMTNEEMQATFAEWNKGDLDSYLIGITAEILGKKYEDGSYVLDKILDTAGQKGTGKWTASTALDAGVPLTLIGESVFARCLSAQKEERVAASKVLQGPAPAFNGDRAAFLEDLRKALFAAKVVSYAQGYALMRAAAKEYGWNLNYGGIALMWRGGCIIRSVFLGKIKEAFDRNPDLTNILLDPFFTGKMAESQDGWRRVLCAAIQAGIPAPCMAAGLQYYDGYRCSRLPANLLQAQRDFFGAHTYERTDRPRGEFFHTNWTGEGGDITSTTYNV